MRFLLGIGLLAATSGLVWLLRPREGRERLIVRFPGASIVVEEGRTTPPGRTSVVDGSTGGPALSIWYSIGRSVIEEPSSPESRSVSRAE